MEIPKNIETNPEQEEDIIETIEIFNPRHIEGYLAQFNGPYMGTLGALLSQNVGIEDAHRHALGSCKLVGQLDGNEQFPSSKGKIIDGGIEYESKSGNKYILLKNSDGGWVFKFPKESFLRERFKKWENTIANFYSRNNVGLPATEEEKK